MTSMLIHLVKVNFDGKSSKFKVTWLNSQQKNMLDINARYKTRQSYRRLKSKPELETTNK